MATYLIVLRFISLLYGHFDPLVNEDSLNILFDLFGLGAYASVLYSLDYVID